jgi:hypothetical protein
MVRGEGILLDDTVLARRGCALPVLRMPEDLRRREDVGVGVAKDNSFIFHSHIRRYNFDDNWAPIFSSVEGR